MNLQFSPISTAQECEPALHKERDFEEQVSWRLEVHIAQATVAKEKSSTP